MRMKDSIVQCGLCKNTVPEICRKGQPDRPNFYCPYCQDNTNLGYALTLRLVEKYILCA